MCFYLVSILDFISVSILVSVNWLMLNQLTDISVSVNLNHTVVSPNIVSFLLLIYARDVPKYKLVIFLV